MPAEGIEPSISALHRVICHLPFGINAHSLEAPSKIGSLLPYVYERGALATEPRRHGLKMLFTSLFVFFQCHLFYNYASVDIETCLVNILCVLCHVGISGFLLLRMGRAGFEPATSTLSAWRSNQAKPPSPTSR